MTGDHVIFFNKDRIGHGNDDLGSALLKAFLENVKALEPYPSHIVFMNSGVTLAAEGSEVLDMLSEIEGKGVALLVCGTCLSFLGIKEKLAVGRITNQSEAVRVFTSASKVITV